MDPPRPSAPYSAWLDRAEAWLEAWFADRPTRPGPPDEAGLRALKLALAILAQILAQRRLLERAAGADADARCPEVAALSKADVRKLLAWGDPLEPGPSPEEPL